MTFHWPTEAEIISGVREYAGKVATFSVKAEKITVMLRDNKLAHEIEAAIPGGAKIAQVIEKAVGVEHILAGAVPLVNDVFMLYSLYENFGGKPMDWGHPNDPEAEELLRQRDKDGQ